MSNWVVEGVRLILFNTERKERVVVEKTDGDLTVSSKQRGGEKAGEREKTDEREKPRPAEKSASEPAPKVATAARKSARDRKPKEGVVGTALSWQPIVDAGYEGFAARSSGAELHVLQATSGSWALYVFWARGVMKHIACYPELGKAKVAAQALHDKGLPSRPEVKLSQEMIDNACPAPQAAPKRTGGRKPKTTAAESTPPKTEEPAPSAPKPTETPEQVTTLTPEVREELRGSLKDAIKTAFNEME